MKKFSLLLLVFFGILLAYSNTFSQAITSAQPGPWNLGSTWNGGVVPDFTNSTSITVNHNVTIPSGFSALIDQTTISSGATVTVNNGGNLNIFTATANQLVVNGTLEGAQGSTITGANGTNLRFTVTGQYRHSFTTTEGFIPLATWNTGSLLEIAGYTTFTTATAGGNWGQNFNRVTWNCTGQTSTVILNGAMNLISGDFQILSTGTGLLQLSTNQNPTISVGGNLTVSGTSRVDLSTTGTATTVNITGNLIFNSTNATGSQINTSGVCNVNIGGNFSMNASGGLFSLANTPGATGVGTLNISGDFDLIAGTLTERASGVGSGNINFVGTNAIHLFSNSGSILNRINYLIPVTNTLIVLGESNIVGNANSSLTVNGILQVESTNANGAIQTGSGPGAGNIRTVNRIYNSGSQIIYAGAAAQFIGNGNITVAGVNTIIDNASGVSLNNPSSATVTIGGDLTIRTGNLTVENDNLTVGGFIDLEGGDIYLTTTSSVRTITANGNLNIDGGELVVTSGTANANLILAGDLTGSNFITFSGANSNLVINGSGPLSIDFPLSGPTTLEAITVNRIGGTVVFLEDVTSTDVTVNNGNIVMNASLTLVDDLNLASGTTLFFEDQTLELRSQFNNTLSGGVLSSNESSVLNILGAGILGTLEFSGSGNTLGTFSLDRTAGGTLVTLNSQLTIVNILDLLNGDFVNTSGLDFAADATFTRDSKSLLTGAIPSGGPYNLIYTSVNLTTGVESQGNLDNLTSNLTSVSSVTVNNPITCSGILTINSGSFTCGTNAVSAGSVVNLGILNGGSSTLSINGSFTNDGTFNKNTGTVSFSGTSSVLGTTNPTFQNLTIASGTFTAPGTLNISGAFTNDGTFSAGTGTVAFLGTAGTPQLVSGSSVTDFNNISVLNTSANPDVQIQSQQNLLGVLTLASNAVFDADGSANTSVFTLRSAGDSPTVDAGIATLPNGAQVTGEVTVERYMSIEGPNGGRIYRYISSPVQNASVADIQSEIPVTGSFSGTSSCTGCGTNQSMFLYDETAITDTNGDLVIDSNDGYVDFPSSSNSETFSPGIGYAMFVRGNLLVTSAIWNVRGSINQGNVTPVTLPSTFSSSGASVNDGWNLVGNPYPSTIDWNSSAGWTKTNVGGSIYIRDNGTDQFTAWNGTVGVNGGSRYIPTGQGFWIQATNTPTLTANENVKVAGQQTTFFRETPLTDLLRITMAKGNVRDETVIHFRSDAKDGYDAETDSRKFPNSTFNLSSMLSSGESLAINSSPFKCSEPVMLNITNAPKGLYKLMFSEIETFADGSDIMLRDNFLNKTVDVKSIQEYEFSITSDLASFGANRFSISFSDKVFSDELQFLTEPICEGENGSITILNSRANANYSIQRDGLPVSDPLKGNGEDLLLSISKANLSSGLNNILIQATTERCLSTKAYEASIMMSAKPTVETTSGKVCNEGSIILKANGSSESDSYRWYADQESDIILSTEAEFVTPVISKSRTYFVAALNASGCMSDRHPVFATVNQTEDVKIEETEDGVLHSSHPDGNRWFFNGEEINGATSSALTPEKSGTYKVERSIDGCSSSFEYEFVITAIERQDLTQFISIYPNPAEERVYIEVVENKLDIRKAVLFTSAGNNIAEAGWREDNGVRKGVIEMSSLPTGIYIIRLVTSDRVMNFKIYKK